MGTPLHPRDPDNVGDTCPSCDPDPWGDGMSPKLIRIVFHNVQPEAGYPEPPNDLPMTAEQSPVDPCRYDAWITFGGQNWIATYYAGAAQFELAWIFPPNLYYFSGYCTPCMAGPAPNDFVLGSAYGYGGSAFALDLPLDYVLTLALDYALGTDDELLYEDDPATDPDQRCIRFVGRTSPGCCWILLDLSP